MIFTADDLRRIGGSERTVEAYLSATPRKLLHLERMVVAALHMTGAITESERQGLLHRRYHVYKVQVTIVATDPEGNEYIGGVAFETFKDHDEQLRHQGRYIEKTLEGWKNASIAHLQLDHPRTLEQIAEDEETLAG